VTRVKICGINSEAAFDVAVELQVDFVGFVFFQGSPRHVTARQAAGLSGRHEGGPLRVGLFVEPSNRQIQAVLDAMSLDGLQIYASEQRCREIRGRFGLRVGRAIGVACAEDLPEAALGLDCLVVEAKPPPGATRPGGNATSLDWRITKDWKAPVPWLLAGGLTADNVASAIAQSHAPGVDVSSGVESLPGVKSPALIRRFVANVRTVVGGR
jgi:phosphoribosylanthranilate isomerase